MINWIQSRWCFSLILKQLVPFKYVFYLIKNNNWCFEYLALYGTKLKTYFTCKPLPWSSIETHSLIIGSQSVRAAQIQSSTIITTARSVQYNHDRPFHTLLDSCAWTWSNIISTYFGRICCCSSLFWNTLNLVSAQLFLISEIIIMKWGKANYSVHLRVSNH